MNITRTLAASGVLLLCTAAQAFPIAVPGTEGFEVVVSSTDHVVATYEGTSASYSNDLYLNGVFIFNNQTTPWGSTVDLGSYAVGTELVFELRVQNTGDSFFTGPASRNPDAAPHARVQAEWVPGSTLVSFEDLYGGPFDYNDLSFSFTNTVSVPEPSPWGLMLAGLGGVALASRRRLR